MYLHGAIGKSSAALALPSPIKLARNLWHQTALSQDSVVALPEEESEQKTGDVSQINCLHPCEKSELAQLSLPWEKAGKSRTGIGEALRATPATYRKTAAHPAFVSTLGPVTSSHSGMPTRRRSASLPRGRARARRAPAARLRAWPRPRWT